MRDPLGGEGWIELFLEHADERVDARLRARVIRVQGATYDMSARSHLAEREYVRARELFLEAGDDEAAAHLLGRIAVSALQQSDFERAASIGRRHSSRAASVATAATRRSPSTSSAASHSTVATWVKDRA